MTGGLTLEVAGESSSDVMHVQGAEPLPNSDAEPVVGTVCYLDFDGVLHRDAVYKVRGRGILVQDGELFEWAHFLEEALLPYPHLRIVLSTSWVRELGFDEARSFLPPALNHRVIGATFHRREHGPTRELRTHWSQTPRGMQVAQDVVRRKPMAWLAIDDAVDEFSQDQSARLVPCKSDLGLSDAGTRRTLQEMLERINAR